MVLIHSLVIENVFNSCCCNKAPLVDNIEYNCLSVIVPFVIKVFVRNVYL